MNQVLNSVLYTKLASQKSPIRKTKNWFALMLVIALVSISSTLIYSRYNLTDEVVVLTEEHEKIIADQQANHLDKRTIIFPNSFPLADSKLVEYYIKDLEEALDSQDLLFRNRFTHRLPEGLSYKKEEIELFSAWSDDITDKQCPTLSKKIKVEGSPPANKNSDLKKILTKFMTEDSIYYQEVKPFFPDLKKQLDEDTIDKHWFQLIGSSVYLQQYGVHLMISRVFYTQTGQKVQPVISLSYLQVFDRDWNELENVELIVPKEDGSYKPILYPQFATMPVYHNEKQTKGRFYGVEDPRIQLITNPQGYEEPIIVYNSHHRKIRETEFDNDAEGTVKFKSYRSIFMAWLWRTQTGKSNLEELPTTDATVRTMEYIKVKEIRRPNDERSSTEKNWALFVNHQERLEYGYDNYMYFVYQFRNLKILKCPIYEDESCTWEYQADEKMGSGLLHGGSELININKLLDQYDYPEFQTLKDKIPKDRELWIGLARAVMVNCGCGSKMYRPNLVVLMKQGKDYKFAYVSSFFSLGIVILPWEKGKSLCEGKNLIIPNGISSWTIEREDEKLVDYMAFTISRKDSTVEVVHMKGLLNALLLDDPHPRLLDTDQQGFTTNTQVDCALNASKNFCQVYAANIKAIENVEEEEPKDDKQ
ncbi:Beta-mannosyltransferase 1 [Candida viswanathii]|uniref:Beta-mannosyltransferase 1 n=1 Tax=Candida viswanathii TaxID=5486 RepID=A0A367XV88_9ASCO|nr:Beta-mannosyltransferase 1 [Candida viswanathii]